MSEFLIVINGKPQGPYPLEELKARGLRPGSFVKTEGMVDFKEAREVPELCELLGIHIESARPQYFAGLDVRLLAVLIDYLIICACYCIVVAAFIWLIPSRDERIGTALAALLVIPFLKFVYSVFMESSQRQGTWGKVFMNIRVTDEAGRPISLRLSILRNISKLLSSGTLGIGYLIGFFDKKQQCLHDRIAGTLVVRDRLI